MATYRVIAWKGIPSLVEAREGDRTARVPLSQRFQDLIDAVAMRQGASATEAYLDGWEPGAEGDRPGDPAAVASTVAAELEASFEVLLSRHLLTPSP